MQALTRRLMRREGGSIAIEFALGAAVFFTVLFAMIEISWLGYNQAALSYATSKAARAGSIAEGTLSNTQLATLITDTLVGIDATPTIVQTQTVDQVTGIAQYAVRASFPFESLTSLAPFDDVELSAHASGSF